MEYFATSSQYSSDMDDFEINIEDEDPLYEPTNRQCPSEAEPLPKRYKCRECKFVTKWKHYLKLHKLTKHSKSKASVPLYKCTVCSFQTKWGTSLRAHMVSHNYQTSTKYQCDQCDFQTRWKQSIKQHSEKHKCKRLDLEKSEIYHQCTQCNFKTTYKNYLKRHRNIHLNENMYRCAQCHFTTRWEPSLLTHLSNSTVCGSGTSHQKEPLQAQLQTNGHFMEQQMEFPKATMVHSQEHKTETMNGHTKKELIYCTKCDFRTHIPHYYRTHMQKHDTPYMFKQYNCPECDFKTALRKELTQHLDSEHDLSQEGMYKCPSCPFRTKNKRYIRVHIAHHSYPKKCYKCDHCKFSTSWKQYLKRHVLDKHSFRCSQCAFTGSAKYLLDSHIMKTHKHFGKIPSE